MAELLLPQHVICCQEICHAEGCLPLTAPGPTPKRRLPRQTRVMSADFICSCRGQLSADRHVHVMGSLTLCGHARALLMFVVVEHTAGGVRCTRDGPGRWEGERRPGTGAEASSDAQGKEGKYRFWAMYEVVLVQFGTVSPASFVCHRVIPRQDPKIYCNRLYVVLPNFRMCN